MDIVILISVAVGLISLIIFMTFLTRRNSDKNNHTARIQPHQVRRAAGVRNARRRMQSGRALRENFAHDEDNVMAEEEEDADADDDDDDDENENADTQDRGKIGAKKRAKLDAKAERKQQRESLAKEREERKIRDELLQAEVEKQRKKDKIEELRQEEAEKKAREERERQEYNEYLKMKEAFRVEEEGFDQDEIDDENLLQEFLQYIRFNKVVMLNDLVSHFKLKHENVVERIHDLQANGSLTGVIDDRGKFIYISQTELEAVAKFVKQRGRVSIVDLAENSNRLINLNPGNLKAQIQVE